jgi:hypothetical protein
MSTFVFIIICTVILAAPYHLYAGYPEVDDESSAMRQTVTIVMYATMVPAGIVGGVASWMRQHYFSTYVLPLFRCGHLLAVNSSITCMFCLSYDAFMCGLVF